MAHRIGQSSASREQALQRLFTFQEFSLAKYASQAQLYAGDGERECLAAIMEIAQNQTARAAEIGSLLSTRRVYLQREGFPMYLTGLNYLGAAYVARRMLAEQPVLIAAIRECVGALHGDPDGQVLARRTLAGEEKSLRDLKRVLGGTSDAAANMRIAA
jgi:hypothetical protein